MAMSFYLSDVQLPVPPSKYDLTVKQLNSTVNINDFGDLNMLGKTSLVGMTLSGFFPNQKYGFCQCTPDAPYSYVNKILEWKNAGPITVVITETPVNYKMLIDSFSYGEHDGSGSVYYTIELKEYKLPNAQPTISTNKNGLQIRPILTIPTITTTVNSIQNLMDIARLLSPNDANTQLNIYQKLAQQIVVSPGDIVKFNGTSITVGGKNVFL